MNLQQTLLTKSYCYQSNINGRSSAYTTFQKRGPLGIMIHSTGANNPKISRYVPAWDDLELQKCVHAFVGKLADGSIGSMQTLPWNFRGLHCGTPGNNTHIGIEICEDNLTNRDYCLATYREIAELCALLCGLYKLDPTDRTVLLCHSEGYKLGIATNHADVMHWWPKHGLTMDAFRADVAKILRGQEEPELTEDQVRAIITEFLQASKISENSQPVHVWAQEAWEQAAAAGVFDGTMPRAALTREQAALVLKRLGLL